MKRTLVTILLTAIFTSFCWHIGITLQRTVDRTWQESSVIAPGRMALDAISEDMKSQNYALASRRIEILRQQWSAFEEEGGLGGKGIGTIMVEFGKLQPANADAVKK